MTPDAVIAELQNQNTVLWASMLTVAVCCVIIAFVAAWLEAKLESGCADCSHCEFRRRERAARKAAAQNAYEHRAGFHEKDCPCQEGGPPRPRS